MSDTIETPAASSVSAPASTADIVKSSIADLPDTVTDTDVTAAANTDIDGAPPADVSTEEADELATALGIADRGKAKWQHRVAYSKLHKVIKEREQKAKDAHDAAVREHTGRASAFEQQIAAFEGMVANPQALLSALAQVNPAYAPYLQTPAGRDDSQTPPKFETAADLQRYVESQISSRLAPIERERQERQVIEAAIPRVKSQLAEAEKLPLFAENKADILAALQKNPAYSLQDAYMAVCLPKFSASRDQIRQEYQRELNARPHATTTTSTASSRTTTDTGPRSTADIIRDSLRGQN